MRHLFLALLCLLTPLAQAQPTAEPDAAFDSARYQLGYEVYLARGNQAAALQLARKAVRARPQDPVWLKRHAQSAEWAGEPAEALAAWLKLAQGGRSEEAWTAVQRLAPSLLNDEALLAYQQHRLRSQGATPAQLEALVQTYERLGQGRAGLSFLAEQRARQPSRELAQAESLLAERVGEDVLAIELLSDMIQRYGPEESWLLRRSALRGARGQMQEAWSELQAVEGRMPKSAAAYWQSYADLSRLLNQRDEARRAYKVLTEAGRGREADLANYAALLQGQDGLAAARLSEGLFRHYGQEPALIAALHLYQRERRPALAQKLLQSLGPEQLARLEGQPDFLEQRAQLAWSQRRLSQARRDYWQALSLAPGQSRLLQGLVSVLLEQGDHEALQGILSGSERRAQQDAQLWSLWGLGWSQLGQASRALPFRQAVVQASPKDALARLALADTLESLGDFERAQSLRAAVLRSSNKKIGAEQAVALENALLALRLDRSPPEPALHMLRQRLSRAQAKGGKPDPVARELALSWLMSQGAEDRARLYLQQRYAGAPPLWAQLSLDLQAHDQAGVAQTLARQGDGLPRPDFIEAARFTEAPAWAESLAFTATQGLPQDDALAEQFARQAEAASDWVELSLGHGRLGALERDSLGLAWESRLRQHWRWGWQAEQLAQDSRNLNELGEPPDPLRRFGLTLSRESQRQDWRLSLRHSSGLDDFITAGLGWRGRLDSRLSLLAGLDYQEEATETSALLVAGMKDQLSLGLNWAFSGRNSLALEFQAQEFYSQDRSGLGQGHMLNLDLGHRLRAGGLEQSLRLGATLARFSADDGPLATPLLPLLPAGQQATPAFFMPEDYEQIGLYWTFGDAARSGHQRVWRPFGELGINHSSTEDLGFSARLGLGGPVLGYDRLLLLAEGAESGARNGDSSQRLLLSYRYFY